MKYCLCPGIVRSIRDEQKHYISAPVLARLYRVPMEECMIWEPGDPVGAIEEDTILLWPRTDGKYEVPK